MPKLQPVMSHEPNHAYSGKPINVGLAGVGMFKGIGIFKGADGQLDGLTIRLTSLLQRKMKFKINYVTSTGTTYTGIDMVIKG